ncbi:hypothetical protein AR687_10600 [Flavobacteriaceae bacterium CRH]|nr:hypothetical protein AR687_10600 [Flavobacteriaceae bacterium CRH]
MKSTLAYVFHFLYWVWFLFYFFFTVDEIITLKTISVGEKALSMIVSTFVYFFVGLILYLFTITYEIENKMNKHLRSASIIIAVALFALFFLALRGNSKLSV